MKVLTISFFFALLGVANVSFATEENSQLNSRVLSATKEAKFGLILGESTLDDVKNPTAIKYSEFDYVSRGGKSAGGIDIEEIKVYSFSKDGNDLIGKFYNNTLFELRLSNGKGEERYDDDGGVAFVKDVKSSFNKKYKKLKSYSRKEKDDFFNWTYKYDAWAGANNSYIVEIEERRKVVHSPQFCFERVSVLRSLTLPVAQLEFYCHRVTDNLPEYAIAYKDLELNSIAYEAVVKDKLNREKDTQNKKNREINKF